MRGIAAGNFKEVSEQDDMWPKLIIYSDGWDSENERKKESRIYLQKNKVRGFLSVPVDILTVPILFSKIRNFDRLGLFPKRKKERPKPGAVQKTDSIQLIYRGFR